MISKLADGILERLTLYCNAMQVPLPELRFEDDDLLWTAELEAFIRSEGICFRWLMMGQTESTKEKEFRELVERMTPDRRSRLLACLRDHQANGGSLEDAMRRHGLDDFD